MHACAEEIREVGDNRGFTRGSPGSGSTNSITVKVRELLHPDEIQTIQEWSVLRGTDKLCGQVFNRPGKADGGTITTNRVQAVYARIFDVDGTRVIMHVAKTDSGSEYLLGRPARGFGLVRAEEFLLRKLDFEMHVLWAETESEGLSTEKDPDTLPSSLVPLPGEQPPGEWSVETVILDATSFQPLED